jgi:tetratricopeptide (TPR) repeat protein
MQPDVIPSPAGVVSLLCILSILSSFPNSAIAQTTAKSRELASDIQQAQADLKVNDQAGAAELFRAVLKLDPSNVEAHANLGVIAFFHGDCPTASRELKAAVHSAPSLTKPQALLSICERRMGDPKAQADMEKAFAGLEDVKLRTQVGIELADLYYQQGDLTRTASVLHMLSSLSPENVDILFFEQRVYSELADSALNKLALLAPDSARMEQLIAERLINAGDLKGAIAHYRKALQSNPHLPGMHFELAESLMEASPNSPEAQKEATAELEAAAKVDGDSSKVESQLGHIALLQSDPDRAMICYRRALELTPEDSQAEIGMAELLKTQNKPEEAAKYLRMAVAADPLNAEAHYKLSQVARQLHLEDEQKRELNLFLEIRANKDKIKALYRQMNPQTQVPAESEPNTGKP